MSTENELLLKCNIFTNCKAIPKDDVIREIGNVLVKSDYVNEDYIEAMLKRELTFSTYLGSGIAMPHGVDEAKKDILDSGMAVMIFPEGVNWDGNTAYIVIGLAGKEDEHLGILGNLANVLLAEDAVSELIKMDVEGIYNTFCNSK